MDRDSVLDDVKKRVLEIPGVVEVRFLDHDLKEEVKRLEALAEKNGAIGGLMPFTNKGVWESLSREVCLIMIGNALLITHEENLISLRDGAGHVLGKYIPPEKKEKIIKEYPNARFLSEDFIMFQDVEVVGEPYFLIDEVRFNFLDDIKEITHVTSASISSISDDFIRTHLCHYKEKMWTHLVGFDFSERGSPL